jgi:hypothetical protein
VKRRLDLITMLMIISGPLILFGPMLLRGEALFWGTPLLQFVPWHRYAIEILRAGHIPLWNPLLGAGAPLLANYQSALLYPPNLLLLLTGPEYGHGLLVCAHLILAGLGMQRLARRVGIKHAGQLVAAVAFSLSGYMIARAGFISINHTAAWLPWVILSLENLLEAVRKDQHAGSWIRPLALLSMALGLQWLAGHAQTAWYTLLLMVSWFLWRVISWQERRLQFKAIGLICGACGLAFAMAAVQLLPTLEYLMQTSRAAAIDMDYALTYSFWPWRILGMLLPDLFGSPAHGDFWGYGNYWEDAIYIGVLPLLGALSIILKKLRAKDSPGRMVRFLLVVGAVTLLFALGKNTPFFPFLFRHVPTFGLFQAPARWNLLFVFSLALLAGLGIDRWSTPSGRGLYWTRLGTVGAAIIGLAAFIGFRWLGDIEASFVRSFAIAGLLLAASGILTLFLPKDYSPRMQLVLGGFLLLDLVWAGWGLNPSLPTSVYEGETTLKELISGEDTQRLFMPSEVEYTATFERSHRFETFDPGIEWRLVREAGIPNTPLLEDIPSLNNFDPFVPSRYALFIEAVESADQDTSARLLALAGVKWSAFDSGEGPLGVQYREVRGSQRVWLMPEAIVVDSEARALALIRTGTIDPLRSALVEAPADVATNYGGSAHAVLHEQQDPNRVQLSIDAPKGTWLVLADSWYPGWRLFIDSEPSEMFPAFVAFRGAWIPPGDHEVELSYLPVSFYSGAMLSLIGWVLWGLLYWRWHVD